MNKKELQIIQLIAKRASSIRWPGDLVYRAQVHWMQDIETVHEKTPLNLNQLLHFSVVDFAHDMAGIAFHLNRAKGRLEDQFVPRCVVSH